MIVDKTTSVIAKDFQVYSNALLMLTADNTERGAHHFDAIICVVYLLR